MSDFKQNLSEIELNQFEYCYLAEDVNLPATTAKVYIPKLMPLAKKEKPTINNSMFINDAACKPTVNNNVSSTDYYIVKVFNMDFTKVSTKRKTIYAKCEHECPDHGVHTCECNHVDHYIEYLPKGKQMIVCFMDNNVNDPYLTNFI